MERGRGSGAFCHWRVSRQNNASSGKRLPTPYGAVNHVALFTHVLISDDCEMPRFVLLHHECPPSFGKPSHWDLMLERDGVLLTWSLAALPAAWREEGETAEEQLAATRLADHRIEYLDFEGPISGERGVVTRVDGGEYKVIEETEQAIRVRLQGEEPHKVVVMLSL